MNSTPTKIREQPDNEAVKLHNFRNQATKEIITSEETYLKQLEIILHYFATPLRKSNILKASKSGSFILHIFGQIEMIHKLNKELLTELTDNIENLAKAFLKFAPFLKLYSVYAFDYKKTIFQIQVGTKIKISTLYIAYYLFFYQF